MPEGHITHRNARRLAAALTGRALTVEAPEPRLAAQRIPERLEGRRVTAVDAAGKHLLVRFDDGAVLHSHLGMVGSWRVVAAADDLPRRGLWLVLRTEDHAVAQYRGPHLRLVAPGAPLPAVAVLGPDLLSPDVDPAEATAAALARVDPARAVGEAILDQRVVAGVGNVYRCETLFLCGIDPWRTVGSLTAEERRLVGSTAARLLAQAARDTGAARPAMWVYRRAGRPCRRCGTPIRSRGQGDANRTAYWCPACQS
ncbi:MAG: DNA-formamidopyrimidine glycosylase family protein, partial [Actinomycetota bacterium]